MMLDIFQSLSGDCILVTSRDGKRILADGGLPEAYSEFVAGAMGKLRDDGHDIDVVYVSHIDRDHIGGVLRMLDTEVLWRAHEFKLANGRKSKIPTVARPPRIGEIWHNAFLETIAETNALKLGTSALTSALTTSADILGGLTVGGKVDAKKLANAERVRMLANSVGDALEVNWRISDAQLGIPLNPAYGGKFMVARAAKLNLGAISVTVVAPTSKELKELRDGPKGWNEWLGKNADYVKKLKKAHAKDEEVLSASLTALERADAANQIALALEDDVTPPNLASLVLLLEEDDLKVLMTGDVGDETLIGYLEDSGLGTEAKPLEVDVLKVPHHGAHNSFSVRLLDHVHACHYVFCGDGENDNPEQTVVRDYIAHCVSRARPHKGAKFEFWFNCSSSRCANEWRKHWRDLEQQFVPAPVRAVITAHFLTSEEPHRIQL